MAHNMILYFRLPYFHVSNCALFATYYFSTLILYRRSLDTFYQALCYMTNALFQQWFTYHVGNFPSIFKADKNICSQRLQYNNYSRRWQTPETAFIRTCFVRYKMCPHRAIVTYWSERNYACLASHEHCKSSFYCKLSFTKLLYFLISIA